MNENVLKTSADDLYELVRARKKISVEDAAKLLKISDEIVQSLVDFLVEEKIFGIEYKFTTPYIYISQEKKKVDIQSMPPKKMVTKEEFFQKAGKWNITTQKINDLWQRYIKENLSSIKDEFYAKANSRNLSSERIDTLWKKYLAQLQ